MRRSSYKVTFLDRYGPEGMLRVKALGFAAVVFVLGGVMSAFLAQFFGLSGLLFIVFTLVAAFTLSVLSLRMGTFTSNAAGAVATYVTAGGSNTPYEEQFSQEQALVMKEDYATALALFEQRIAQNPGEPRARIAAADLYMTHGANPQRAAELFREVQRIPGVMSGHDVYASNRLADLYLGPLANPGRALVELRRIAERYPGSRQAEHARAALANLKKDLSADQSSS